MHTKQQIQRFLESEGVSPNHRRGQNFLIDLNLMQILIDSASLHSNDVVLEVGCGTGSLTEEIAQRAGKVISVEINPVLLKIASKQLEQFDNVEFINTDILESKNTIDSTVKQTLIDAKDQFSGRFLLVSNLPYSISSPLMINLVTSDLCADQMFVTVQKEVAHRMTASPGNKEFGTLSIFLSATGEIKTIRTLKPSVFWPQPQVDSAMVSFIRNKQKVDRIHNINIFCKVVNLFMQHRRKMIKACVKFAQPPLDKIHSFNDIFADCAIDPHERPEQLSADEYIAIANLVSEFISNS